MVESSPCPGRHGTSGTVPATQSASECVAETSPPMMTTASGRCTSEPMPWESAMGSSPSIASIEVISTVRSRVCAPSKTASYGAVPCFLKLIEVTDHHHAVQHRLSEQRDEADRRRDAQMDAGEIERRECRRPGRTARSAG